jgi:hypothetical protein
MDKSISQINARFHTGASDERYCDCIGLILLHLKNNNYQPIDEELIPRGITKHRDIQDWLRKCNCSEVSDISEHKWLLALMYYDDENGHLGVYFPDEDTIYHMAPFGLCATRPASNMTFWKYHGD